MELSFDRRIRPHRRTIYIILLLSVFGIIVYIYLRTTSSKFVQLNESRKAPNIDCRRLFNGEKAEIIRAIQYENKGQEADDNSYYMQINNCESFMKDRLYITYDTTQEEQDFPIAFSLLAQGNIRKLERLFRSIYRPQNVYCIHVDLKVEAAKFAAFEKIISCFPNAFMASKRFSVEPGRYSALEAEVQCMRDLNAKPSTWRYLINLRSHEFPLRTNLEFVRIFRLFNGANNIGIDPIQDVPNLLQPSFHMTWVKGNDHIAASRDFINFLLTSKQAEELLLILKNRDSTVPCNPGKLLFATLNHNPSSIKAPGGHTPVKSGDTVVNYHFITQLSKAGLDPKFYKIMCTDQKALLKNCNWRVRDLQVLLDRPELFVDDIFQDVESGFFDCLEESHMSRTVHNMKFGKTPIDMEFYDGLEFIHKK